MTLAVILARPWVPDWLQPPLSFLLSLWLFAWLVIALRKVYGGSRAETFLKFTGVLTIYGFAFAGMMVLMVMMTLWLY